MRIATILGARPQFVKAGPVSRALRQQGVDEVLIHTGQHYDDNMSQIFFRELDLPRPAVNLGVGSGPAGWQTAQMLIGIEERLRGEPFDRVLVYGDTNSTLAGALAACKSGLPLAHVEAGVRSFNRSMPEEHNRVVTDHLADLLFCPTSRAVENLEREGLGTGVHLVGDTMLDALLAVRDGLAARRQVLDRLGVAAGGYLVVTVHRSYNTDRPERLAAILEALAELPDPIVFPIHPRTREAIDVAGLGNLLDRAPRLRVVEPLGYLDMLTVLAQSRLLLTDSGGMQKEAYYLGVPCVTLRPETEWPETVDAGWNVLADADPERIQAAVSRSWPASHSVESFGGGRAATSIAATIEGSGDPA